MGEGFKNWITLAFGGIGVAAFTFLAPIVWDKFTHRSVGPDTIETSLRLEGGQVFVVVRNNSDEPLDLVEAEIEFSGLAAADQGFAAFPEPSHLYEVDSRLNAKLTESQGKLRISTKIAQAIAQGDVDQFGFKISGNALKLESANSITGKIKDINGNVFPLRH
ncbi:MAG: hypothetical protein ACKVP5_22980 [Aestuariivirga sp.]